MNYKDSHLLRIKKINFMAINNEKLKRISLKLIPDFSSNNDLEEIYLSIMKLTKKQKLYFSRFTSQDLLKIVFYIYSKLNFNNFDIGETMIKEAYVVSYLTYNSNDFATIECEECDGSGDIECIECSGNGQVRCDECDGNGNVECSECDGYGTIGDYDEECSRCESGGSTPCRSCDEGYVNCSNCDSNGKFECETCDQTGEMESDTLLNFTINTYTTWNKKIISSFRNSYELETPLDYNIDEDFLNRKILHLSTQLQVGELNEDIDPEKEYCFYIETLEESKLYISADNNVINLNEFPNQYFDMG
jgi:hypothetical protein